MAIPWLTVLQIVPWRDVVNNAPKVAEGAKKLWSTIGGKSASPARSAEETRNLGQAETLSAGQLQAYVRRHDTALDALHAQMLESSALITSLAEQNTQLIKRIEQNRVRVLWLAAMTAVIGVLVLSLLIGS